jgi:CheY-like chemotaxis protein
LHHVSDGVEALAFLRKQGQYSDAPQPDLILLDLNMPKMDGREVLEKMKQDAQFKRIPVVVLTTSQDEEDIRATALKNT